MNITDYINIKLKKNSGTNKKGIELVGAPCPICNQGKNDTFHVWPELNDGEGSFWCRSCNRGGNLVRFIMLTTGKTWKDAHLYIGKELPPREFSRTPSIPQERQWEPRECPHPPQMWQDRMTAFQKWTHRKLLESPEQMEYLQSRGITSESVREYQLGYNPGEDGKPIFRPREIFGLQTVLKENGQKLKLCIDTGIIIPAFSHAGSVIRLRARVGKGEYKIVAGSSTEALILYGDSRAVLIVEAELDGILIHQECKDLLTVVCMGNAQTRPDTIADKVLRKGLVILNALDNDEAGHKEKDWWDKHYQKVIRAITPDVKDPGDLYQSGGNIREWILSVLPPALRTRAPGPVITPKNQDHPLNVLYKYLSDYPIHIVNGKQKVELIGWESVPTGKEMTLYDLLNLNPETVKHITTHPAATITKSNFWR